MTCEKKLILLIFLYSSIKEEEYVVELFYIGQNRSQNSSKED